MTPRRTGVPGCTVAVVDQRHQLVAERSGIAYLLISDIFLPALHRWHKHRHKRRNHLRGNHVVQDVRDKRELPRRFAVMDIDTR